MTQKEALKYFISDFNGDELAATVWLNKYALRDSDDNILESSRLERFKAIEKELQKIDNEVFKASVKIPYADYFSKGLMMPAGSNLFGIANPYSKSSLGNCFVVDSNGYDSYSMIHRIDEYLTAIAKRRGGVGTGLNDYRPRDWRVNNSARSSSGSVSFAPRFSNTIREVSQNGRRGALMLWQSIHHFDIEEFIKVKQNTESVTGANISVQVSDEFMYALMTDGLYVQRFPLNNDMRVRHYMKENIVYTEGKNNIRLVRAKKIWDLIVEANKNFGEPGVLFMDTVWRESQMDLYPNFKTVGTNPCGELLLSDKASCMLLSVNLNEMVINPFTKQAKLNRKLLKEVTRVAVHVMDNIVELELKRLNEIISKINSDPEPEELKRTERALWQTIRIRLYESRRIGISLIGHGDFLAKMGYKYDEDRSIKLLESIHEEFAKIAFQASIDLAKQRGPFPYFGEVDESNNPFLTRLGIANVPRRHMGMLTIPPSGSISIILGNQSSGIEPVFSLYYYRNRKVEKDSPNISYIDEVGDAWETYAVLHPGLQQWYNITHKKSLDLSTLSEEELKTIIAKSPYYESTANEINSIKKVHLQGAIQKWIDHSISVTHNLPKGTGSAVITNILLEAYDSGCKGCTIYVDGSRKGVLSSTKNTDNLDEFKPRTLFPRPRSVQHDVYYPTINGKKYVICVGIVNDYPFEVFAMLPKRSINLNLTKAIIYKRKSKHYELRDLDNNILLEDIREAFEIPDWEDKTRLVTGILRSGGSIDFIIEQLNKSQGSIVSVSKAIARTLKRYANGNNSTNNFTQCPVCKQNTLKMDNGCEQCVNPKCGYGKCV